MKICQDPNSLLAYVAESTDNTSGTSENKDTKDGSDKENSKSQQNFDLCNSQIKSFVFAWEISIFLLIFSCKRKRQQLRFR